MSNKPRAPREPMIAFFSATSFRMSMSQSWWSDPHTLTRDQTWNSVAYNRTNQRVFGLYHPGRTMLTSKKQPHHAPPLIIPLKTKKWGTPALPPIYRWIFHFNVHWGFPNCWIAIFPVPFICTLSDWITVLLTSKCSSKGTWRHVPRYF